jgi:hypothetical protein
MSQLSVFGAKNLILPKCLHPYHLLPSIIGQNIIYTFISKKSAINAVTASADGQGNKGVKNQLIQVKYFVIDTTQNYSL